MSDKVFVAPTLCIDAHALDADANRTVAAALLHDRWATRLGMLSTQVLQACSVNATRQMPSPLAPAAAREMVRASCAWRVEGLGPDMMEIPDGSHPHTGDRGTIPDVEAPRERETSVAELVRQSVDFFVRSTHLVGDEEQRQRALAAADRFRSGRSDLAAAHDRYLAEAYTR